MRAARRPCCSGPCQEEGRVQAEPWRCRRVAIEPCPEPTRAQARTASRRGTGEPGARVLAAAHTGHPDRVPRIELDWLRLTGLLVIRGNHRRAAGRSRGGRTRSPHRPDQVGARRCVSEAGGGRMRRGSTTSSKIVSGDAVSAARLPRFSYSNTWWQQVRLPRDRSSTPVLASLRNTPLVVTCWPRRADPVVVSELTQSEQGTFRKQLPNRSS